MITLRFLKHIPLLPILLIIGFATFYHHKLTIFTDMGWYMNAALNIFEGKGFTDMHGIYIFNRGPFFELLIAAAYYFLGVSAWSAFWVVRLFCILNPCMIYMIGNRFYGKGIGFTVDSYCSMTESTVRSLSFKSRFSLRIKRTSSAVSTKIFKFILLRRSLS